jgi:mono/diheme cytochrome c family protein
VRRAGALRRRFVAGLACATVGATAVAAAGEDAAAGAAPMPGELARGQALFDVHCGICHAAGGTGTFMLGRRLGADNALLARRTDLSPELIGLVVRHGINSMPVFTRVELGDAELALVTAYLGRPAQFRQDGK